MYIQLSRLDFAYPTVDNGYISFLALNIDRCTFPGALVTM